jgi:hypothetical protein
MVTPRPGGTPGTNLARDAKRVWSGAGRGRAGLGPVSRDQPRAGRAAPTAQLHYYGALNVGAGALIGTPVGPSADDILVFQASPTNDFTNGADGSWSSVDGEFTAQTGGYWALWVSIDISPCDPGDVGSLKLSAGSIGEVEVPLINIGGEMRGACQVGPAPAFPDTTSFVARIFYDGTSTGAVITGAQAAFWPTGLFPEVG